MTAVSTSSPSPAELTPLTDEEIVLRVIDGDTALFEVLMRRHNQRAYRVARAILKDDPEAEDAMQQAYINAFTHLKQFESRAQFSTWLTRIIVREALSRRRRLETRERGRFMHGAPSARGVEAVTSSQPDPERQAYARE